MDEIKTCPICGAQGETILDDDGYWHIGCFTHDCPACVLEYGYKEFSTEEKAIEWWNGLKRESELPVVGEKSYEF